MNTPTHRRGRQSQRPCPHCLILHIVAGLVDEVEDPADREAAQSIADAITQNVNDLGALAQPDD
jgi:hypothetical protein